MNFSFTSFLCHFHFGRNHFDKLFVLELYCQRAPQPLPLPSTLRNSRRNILIPLLSLKCVQFIDTYEIFEITWPSLHLSNYCNVGIQRHICESLADIYVLSENTMKEPISHLISIFMTKMEEKHTYSLPQLEQPIVRCHTDL